MTTSLPWGPTDTTGLTPAPHGGGITAVADVRAAGIAAGLKHGGGLDLALIDAGRPVTVAVTTTTNLVKAAPCLVAERHAADGTGRAVVVNAGNANACTGDQGLAAAARVCSEVAVTLGCEPTDVLPLSTGIIGVPLRVEPVTAAVPALVADLDGDAAAGERAARAICTTDTTTKTAAYHLVDAAGSCTIGGMAKGAGMIEPAMATMLAVVAVDAPIRGPVLARLTRQAIARTFNRISVDACGSTNDTVVVLATGSAAATPPGLATVQAGLDAVCADLAHAIVADGEGTSRVATVTVRGAADDDAAERLARAVTASALFRAALHGADPNWGRILAAMGSAGVPFEPARVHVVCGGITVCRFGTAAVFDRGQAAAAMSKDEVAFDVDVGPGPGTATLLTADLTPQYVADNAYYTT